MYRIEIRFRQVGTLAIVLAVLLALSVACAAPEPTPTPVPPAPPAPPSQPIASTATPISTAIPAPGVATSTAALPTPTRILPTPTPAVIGKTQYGGTLKFALNLGVKSLDPRFGISRGEITPEFAIYSTPVGVGPKWEIVPQLVRSWDISGDGKAVTFRLPEGAKFHDGTNFDAEVFKWFIEWQLDPKTEHRQRTQLEAAGIERVTVVDKSTVTLHLKKPYRPVLSTLALRPGFIPSPTAIQKLGKDFFRSPVGAGPFRFVEWLPDDRVTVRRFDNYWDKGKPYLDSILFQNAPEGQVQLAMVRTGETDLIEDIRPQDMELVRRNPNLTVDEHQSGRMRTLVMSMVQEPFSKKALREAIAYSVDRESLIKIAFVGAARLGSGYLTGWPYNPNLRLYDYSPQKAKEKLAQAGYPQGVTIPMWCQSTTQDLQLCEIYAAMMKQVGIGTDMIQVPASDYFTNFVQGKIRFGTGYKSPVLSDPGELLQLRFSCKGPSNEIGYCNPEADRLLAQSHAIYDLAEAKKLLDQVQRLLVEDVPWTFDAWVTVYTVLNSRVQNFVLIPDLYVRLNDLWLSK